MIEKDKPQRAPPDDPEQSKRFVDMAREVEAEESEGALDQAFNLVVRPKVDEKKPQKQRRIHRPSRSDDTGEQR
jgi:hypothetical protein